MVDDSVEYEFKGAVTLRGTEARTIAKWQTEGWELVSQTPGRVRMQLMFRRPKPKSAAAHIAAAWSAFRRLRPAAQAGVALTGALVVAVGITGIALTSGSRPESGDRGRSVATAEPAAALATRAPIAPPAPRSSTTASATASATPTILTRKNNEDLARLLALKDPGDEFVSTFFQKYEGRTIAFNGNIAALANYDDVTAKSCDADVVRGCEFMLGAGDYDENASIGPNFKFEDVHSVEGLRFVGGNAPTRVSTGDGLRVIAVVKGYKSDPQFLYLTPVSTRAR